MTTLASNSASLHPREGEERERELLELARRDPRFFAGVYRSHARAIGAYIFRRTGDPHTTDDLVAETFTLALRALPRFRDTGLGVRCWLYRIATNAVNRWARRERLRRRAADLLAARSRAAASHAAPSDASPDADPAAARHALLSLHPDYQAALTLHHVQGLSLREAALVLHKSEPALKSLLTRARAAMRAALLAQEPLP